MTDRTCVASARTNGQGARGRRHDDDVIGPRDRRPTSGQELRHVRGAHAQGAAAAGHLATTGRRATAGRLATRQCHGNRVNRPADT